MHALEAIDHLTFTQLIRVRAVRGVSVVAQAEGWAVVVKCGKQLRVLAATRNQQVRHFKKLETLVAYLKKLDITKFEMDTAGYDPLTLRTVTRPDRSKVLKQAHQVAAYLRVSEQKLKTPIKPPPSDSEVDSSRLIVIRRSS